MWTVKGTSGPKPHQTKCSHSVTEPRDLFTTEVKPSSTYHSPNLSHKCTRSLVKIMVKNDSPYHNAFYKISVDQHLWSLPHSVYAHSSWHCLHRNPTIICPYRNTIIQSYTIVHTWQSSLRVWSHPSLTISLLTMVPDEQLLIWPNYILH